MAGVSARGAAVVLRTVAMRDAGLATDRCGIFAVVGRIATGFAGECVAVVGRVDALRGAKSIKRPRFCGRAMGFAAGRAIVGRAATGCAAAVVVFVVEREEERFG